jgi:hypothetical protein
MVKIEAKINGKKIEKTMFLDCQMRVLYQATIRVKLKKTRNTSEFNNQLNANNYTNLPNPTIELFLVYPLIYLKAGS